MRYKLSLRCRIVGDKKNPIMLKVDIAPNTIPVYKIIFLINILTQCDKFYIKIFMCFMTS